MYEKKYLIFNDKVSLNDSRMKTKIVRACNKTKLFVFAIQFV